MQPRAMLMLSAKTHFWLMVSLVTTRTPRTFSARLLFSWEASSMYRYLGLFLPSCSTLNFLLHENFCPGRGSCFQDLMGKLSSSLPYWRLFVLVQIHLGSLLYNLLDTVLCLLAVLWELCSCPRPHIDPTYALAKQVLDTPYTVAGSS